MRSYLSMSHCKFQSNSRGIACKLTFYKYFCMRQVYSELVFVQWASGASSVIVSVRFPCDCLWVQEWWVQEWWACGGEWQCKLPYSKLTVRYFYLVFRFGALCFLGFYCVHLHFSSRFGLLFCVFCLLLSVIVYSVQTELFYSSLDQFCLIPV